MEGDTGRASLKPSDPCSACPRAKLYPFSASTSRKRPHLRWSSLWGVRARSAGQRGPWDTECAGFNQAVWRVGTTGVGQTLEVAPGSHSGEAHKRTGISIQWEGPSLQGLDVKGPWSASDSLGDPRLLPDCNPSVLSFDKWGH